MWTNGIKAYCTLVKCVELNVRMKKTYKRGLGDTAVGHHHGLGSGTINNKKRKIENLITLTLKYPFIKGFIASIGMANGE